MKKGKEEEKEKKKKKRGEEEEDFFSNLIVWYTICYFLLHLWISWFTAILEKYWKENYIESFVIWKTELVFSSSVVNWSPLLDPWLSLALGKTQFWHSA